jgi:bifunctional polynucleotide phosphatase/kinase
MTNILTVNKTTPYIDLTIGKFKSTNKLACFDLDCTLINTKSGNTFPIDENDWEFFNDKVISKLTELYNDGFCIVIFSNQKGLSNGKQSPGKWISKIELIAKQLKVPFRCFASISSDIYRKPFPTLYLDLIEDYKNIHTSSFYCGDAAGRPNDFSNTDLKFALNCKLKFMFPEELFANKKIKIPKVIYNIDFDNLNKNDTTTFTPVKKEMIIMSGVPGSGKSTFVKKHLEPANYIRINMDTLKTKVKCIKETVKYLKLNDCIVIDNTNFTKKSRAEYIKLAKEHNYKVRCVIIDCPEEVAIHNAHYRAFINNTKIIPTIVYRTYKKNYEVPSKAEGISEILTIPYCVPDDHRYSYYYY